VNRNESITPIVIEIPGDSALAHSLRECAEFALRTPAAEGLWLIRQGVEDVLKLASQRASADQHAAVRRAWDRARQAGLDDAALNSLQRANVSPDDVARMTDAQLLTLRNVGVRRVAQIRAVIPYIGDQGLNHAEVPA
jgi:hypothetical protein